MKFYIKTYGCQMNEYDSKVAAGVLECAGFEMAASEIEADLVVLNTCSVRSHAEERVFGALRKLAEMKKKKPELVICLMGCMAEFYGEELFGKFEALDIVVGTRHAADLPDLIKIVRGGNGPVARTGTDGLTQGYTANIKRRPGIHTFLPVMTGCENFCSYCVVPYVRGKEHSRPSEFILEELARLAADGVKHVTLLGQNVNSYGRGLEEKINFAELLKKCVKVDGIEMLGFMTSHPKDASEELFRVIAEEPKISRRFHLPLQSGSDRILQLMNRGHSADEFTEKISRLRSILRDAVITTDVIVGFPSETEEEFEETRALMDNLLFDGAYIFKYSPRKGTQAYELEDDVPMEEKKRRNQVLLELQRRITRHKNKNQIGKELPALVECTSRNSESEVLAKTWQDRDVVVPGGKELIGKTVRVRLTELVNETFRGELIND